jgi:hypothetical protein
MTFRNVAIFSVLNPRMSFVNSLHQVTCFILNSTHVSSKNKLKRHLQHTCFNKKVKLSHFVCVNSIKKPDFF